MYTNHLTAYLKYNPKIWIVYSILYVHIQIFQLYTQWGKRQHHFANVSIHFSHIYVLFSTKIWYYIRVDTQETMQNSILHNVYTIPMQIISSLERIFPIILSKYVWLRLAIPRAHSQVTFQKLSIKTSLPRSLSSAKSS